MVLPSHTGAFTDSDTAGDTLLLTVIFLIALAVHPLLSVTITVYVPAEAGSAGKLTGSSSDELKLAGPDQEKVGYNPDPPEGVDESVIGAP
jgi:hypothetical protein